MTPPDPCTCTLNQAPGSCPGCTAAAAPARAEVLDLARRALIAELKGGGHRPACGCECGKAASPAALAAVSRELRAVMAEIEQLPRGDQSSVSADLAARIANDRRATAASVLPPALLKDVRA